MDQLSKYIENKNFILWVFQPDAELETWWCQFDTDHPEEKRNIQQARKVLMKFRTQDKVLTTDEKILLFSKVLRQIEEKAPRAKIRRHVIVYARYAAIALLFFSMGALFFYKKSQFNPLLYSQKFDEIIPDKSAKLIRSNGEDILLKEHNSILLYSADGKLVVNNDTIHTDLSKTASSTAMNQLIIPYGKTSELLLPDGTNVFLNAGSRLMYPDNFSGDARVVYLSGEAYFEVKHDQNHPFIVQVSDLRVKVLGTRFDISAYASDNVIQTVLAEGKVGIENNNAGFFDKSTDLVPDQMATFDRITQETNVITVDASKYILWTKGLLQFESADLGLILKRVERYYNIRFEINDPSLLGTHISGKMELKEDKDEICERIARTASLKIIKKNQDLYEVIK